MSYQLEQWHSDRNLQARFCLDCRAVLVDGLNQYICNSCYKKRYGNIGYGGMTAQEQTDWEKK